VKNNVGNFKIYGGGGGVEVEGRSSPQNATPIVFTYPKTNLQY